MINFNNESITQKHHFLAPFVRATIDENFELKKALEIDDFYDEFIHEKCIELSDETLNFKEKCKVSVIEALDIVKERFKTSIAYE